jgi:large subunit ribosomal protein L18
LHQIFDLGDNLNLIKGKGFCKKMSKFYEKLENLLNRLIIFTRILSYSLSILSIKVDNFYRFKNIEIITMKFSQRTLLKLKNKNKKLKPNKYKKWKRDSIRGQIKGTLERPRLSVYRSNENIYAQIIDDTNSKTLVSCSTLSRSIKLELFNGRTCNASRVMGKKLAELSLKKNITKIVFDRGPYLYHGRIKALADGAREGGLQF